jgi:aryl-alcohol dehydrogenase-like predicted oxidoreductase
MFLSDAHVLTITCSPQEKYKVDTIDVARVYKDAEQVVGNSDAKERFTIDTKLSGGFGAGSSKAQTIEDGEKSKALLKTNVDILYLHAPDKDVPIEETLEGVNEIYQSGFFKRFGLSNFTAENVQKVHDVAKSKGYVLPTVYQGNYNAFARKQEDLLFPTLRKLNISFYAYSPIAGGFLVKTREQIENGTGRWDKSSFAGQLYHSLYSKSTLLDGLDEWHAIAAEEGISPAALAYRWVGYNSPLKPENGDALIFGASKVEQLEDTLQSLQKGPLSEKAVKRIDELWAKIANEAPLDNYHR